MASHDAWIKFYRSDENSPNTTMSYYTRGAVVALLHDVKIQRATAGAKSLDDVMRLAYARYAGERGFTREEWRETIQEVAGIDLTEWFVHVLERTDEVDYTEALEWFGLRFAPPENTATKAWLGIDTKIDNGHLLVTQVRRQTPGWHAGLNVDDEILAIDDYRVYPGQWQTRLKQYGPDQTVTLLIARRERLQRLNATFGAAPPQHWKLAVHPEATSQQQARLQTWLGGCSRTQAMDT
jgi:predicted metalloprotease with PDZ domain